MMELEKKHLFLLGFAVLALVGLYFIHSHLTKKIVHTELKNLLKQKKKNQKNQMKKMQMLENINKQREMQKQRQMPESDMEMEMDMEMKQQDMDSYIDPGNEDDIEVQNTPSSRSSSRLSKDNIMMRDLMDGTRQ